MKRKIVFFITVLVCAGYVKAQETQDVVSMEQGTWGIRVDATSVFKSIGNAFYKDAGEGATFPSELSFDGRYFVGKNKALRLGVDFRYGSAEEKVYNDEDRLDYTDTQSGNSFALLPGFEMRKTFNRLHLLYGPLASISSNQYSLKREYVNDTESDYKITSGRTWGMGIGGFLGVEYFVAERISLGAEFSYLLTYSSKDRDKRETRHDDELSGSKSSNLAVGSANYLNLNLGFYF